MAVHSTPAPHATTRRMSGTMTHSACVPRGAANPALHPVNPATPVLPNPVTPVTPAPLNPVPRPLNSRATNRVTRGGVTGIVD